MSTHLTVAQGMFVGAATGAGFLGVIAERLSTALRNHNHELARTVKTHAQTINDQTEEIDDLKAERDAWRWEVESRLTEERAAFPAGDAQAEIPRPRLYAVGD
jgi:hypothetical protein